MGSNDISLETSVLNKKTDDILREMKKHLSNDEYVLAKKAYDIFNEKVGEYLLSVLNHVEALQDNTRAITTKKIDPYIAGGAMNGIAGPVAGVATAISADNRNKSIDEARKETAQRKIQTQVSESSAETSLKRAYEDVMRYVRRVPSAYEIYTKALNENIGQTILKHNLKQAEHDLQTIKIITIIAAVVLTSLLLVGASSLGMTNSFALVICFILGIGIPCGIAFKMIMK